MNRRNFLLGSSTMLAVPAMPMLPKAAPVTLRLEVDVVEFLDGMGLFDAFAKKMLSEISKSVGLTYEQLSGDLGHAKHSAVSHYFNAGVLPKEVRSCDPVQGTYGEVE